MKHRKDSGDSARDQEPFFARTPRRANKVSKIEMARTTSHKANKRPDSLRFESEMLSSLRFAFDLSTTYKLHARM